ncbi:MAG TPA: ECF transporter S component [Defluviitaleaceae bacterium]|nr:ECF transporter S component [Defluviitaleaceae bacterium]HPT75660.1 ECF transporter S component [Defluviitaleaceae bacterium]HQD50467.1 ECF transporter S component [Defluviitaleaceae bacterium]
MKETAIAKTSSTKKLVIAGMLVAISIILDTTPFGTIRLPIISATISHIPTIIGAILCGPVVGAVVGLSFGVTSMIRNLTQPTSVLAFALKNPLVSVLPRALVGIVSYYIYAGLKKVKPEKNKEEKVKRKKIIFEDIPIVVAAAIGSLTNTIGVLGMMYILYAEEIVAKFAEIGKSGTIYGILLGIASANGIPEAIVSVILTFAVVKSLKRIYNN